MESQGIKQCFDLRPICKERRWKWRYEESFKAERMAPRNPASPGYVEILCKYGTIYPNDKDDLLVCVEGHTRTAAKLKREVPGISQHQGNVVFRFPWHSLATVAKTVKPKKIGGRPVDDAMRAHLAKFRPPRFQSSKNDPESTN